MSENETQANNDWKQSELTDAFISVLDALQNIMVVVKKFKEDHYYNYKAEESMDELDEAIDQAESSINDLSDLI